MNCGLGTTFTDALADMMGEATEWQDRIIEQAEELGRLRNELQGKAGSLGLQAGDIPITMEEAILVPEGEIAGNGS